MNIVNVFPMDTFGAPATFTGPLPLKLAVGLVVAAFAVAILTWIALLGSNPIRFTAPTS